MNKNIRIFPARVTAAFFAWSVLFFLPVPALLAANDAVAAETAGPSEVQLIHSELSRIKETLAKVRELQEKMAEELKIARIRIQRNCSGNRL